MSKEQNGLTWYKQPFDINKPTIIWIHGWGDVRTPNYPHFLYDDRFIDKGYNVATYSWDQELLDLYINAYPSCIGVNPCAWPFNPCWWRPNAHNAQRIRHLNWAIGTYVVTCNSCRKAVLTQVWKRGGSGDIFRNILEGFFGQEKLQSYTEEMTLLGHSTAAQLITLGLRSFVEENNPLEQLKLRVVFTDPWFPKPDSLWIYPYWHNKNPHYDTGLALRILKRVSDKGNPVIFIVSTQVAGGEATDTLSGIESKATCVGIRPDGLGEFLKTMHNYTSMREAAYPWGKDVAHPDGVRHWYAIDWYCELIDSLPPKSYEKVTDPEDEDIYKGRNVPSPNLERTNIQKNRYYSRKSGSTTYSPGDDAFYESNWVRITMEEEEEKKVNDFRAMLQDLLATVSDETQNTVEAVKDQVHEILRALTDELNSWMLTPSAQQAATILDFRDKYKTQIDRRRAEIKSKTEELFNKTTDAVQDVLSAATDRAQRIGLTQDQLKAAIEPLLADCQKNIDNILDTMMNILSSIRESFTNATDELLDRIPSLYIANRNSLEVHRMECVWVSRMNPVNRIPYTTLNEVAKIIQNAGYNGCFYCLQRYDSDTLTKEQVVNNLTTDLKQ